jgi:hypothetical protein
MVLDLFSNLLAAAIGATLAWVTSYSQKMWSAYKAAGFLGLHRGANCRFVIGRYRDQPAASIRDIGALVEAVATIQRFQPVIEAIDDEVSSPCGDVTEFCIGGPDSNRRTTVHLDRYLPGLRVRSVQEEGHRLEITVAGRTFKYERGEAEYAVLAKILPTPNSQPVFVVCGQSALANRGALYYFRMHYDRRLRKEFGLGQFCVIVLVPSSAVYGYKMAEFAADVTAAAFAAGAIDST